MNEKPVKSGIGFQEALRRIAKTPKAVAESVVERRRDDYNCEQKAMVKTPPPAKGSKT